MPNHDHKGPRGEGPMTGRKQGQCGRGHQHTEAPRLGLNKNDEHKHGKGCKHGEHHHDDHHHCDGHHHHHE